MQQKANKNELTPERQNVLICGKDSWEGTGRGQRVNLCCDFVHHWSFIIQQIGAASHRDDLSVAYSHLCPGVYSTDLLKEKNHSTAGKDWKSEGEKNLLLQCFHLKVAVKGRHLEELSSLTAKLS